MNVTVSVIMITYLHDKYIREAIKGVINQQCNFKVELIIADDNSPDQTETVVDNFLEESNIPQNIDVKYKKHTVNKGANQNYLWAANTGKGIYIANCEGDDYWTDPLKLQKQVDFLENNEEFSMCFTKANLLKNGKITRHPIPFNKDTFEGKDLLTTYNFICSASVVFRAEILKNINNIDKYPFGDLALHLNASKAGKIRCLDDITTVYRIHDKGLWSRLNKQDELIKYLNFYKIYFTDATTEEKQIIKEKAYQKILNCKIKAPFIKQHIFKFNLLFKYSFTRTKSIKFAINITKIVTFRVLKKVYGGINKIQHNNTLL